MTRFRTSRNSQFTRISAVLLLSVVSAGCSSWWQEHHANSLLEKGKVPEGISAYRQLADRNPPRYLATYVAIRDRETRTRLRAAELSRLQGDYATARSKYEEVIAIDPAQPEAMRGIELLARQQRATKLIGEAREEIARANPEGASQKLGEVIAEDSANPEATSMLQSLQLEKNRGLIEEPLLKGAMRRKVSLEFRDVSIQAVFELISQTSGINFIFDRDVRRDMRSTIFSKNTVVEDALQLVLRTNQLRMKALNDNTVLIYPDTSDKQKQYEELITRSFYLGSADPKHIQDLIKTMAAPQAMYVDDALRMLVVRDRLEVIETIERLVAAYDLPPPEVLMEVQVMEIGSDDLLNLGVQYPNAVSTSVFGAAGKAGQLTVNELEHLNRSNFQVFLPDPLAILNLQQTSGKANTLANPRIRVRNHEKAQILIGDKVPVVTTTTNTTSTSESVSYLDVGLKLEVVPEVHVNNDVSIDVALEVSNIAKEVKTASGLLTYQIGTRNASTALRLRDGETEVLAGLIRDEERSSASHIPGIGKLPLIGRLFSNSSDTHSKSEIVLLITPHVVRSLHTPAANDVEFASGTANNVGTRPLRLTPAALYSAAPLSNSDKYLPPGGALTSAVPPQAETGSAAVTPMAGTSLAEQGGMGAVHLDLGLAQLRFNMVAPAQIRAGQEFTLAIMASGHPFKEANMDLQFAPGNLELVRSSSAGGLASLSVEPAGSGVHVVAKGSSGDGPVAMLTFKATATTGTAVSIRMAQASAKHGDDIDLVVSAAAQRDLQITP